MPNPDLYSVFLPPWQTLVFFTKNICLPFFFRQFFVRPPTRLLGWPDGLFFPPCQPTASLTFLSFAARSPTNGGFGPCFAHEHDCCGFPRVLAHFFFSVFWGGAMALLPRLSVVQASFASRWCGEGGGAGFGRQDRCLWELESLLRA